MTIIRFSDLVDLNTSRIAEPLAAEIERIKKALLITLENL
jgi:hypothetical protein